MPLLLLPTLTQPLSFYLSLRWYYECKEQWPKTENEVYEKTYTVLLFVFTFALPVGGLGYTYLSIVAMMCTYKMPGNAEPSRDQHHLQAKIKVRERNEKGLTKKEGRVRGCELEY